MKKETAQNLIRKYDRCQISFLLHLLDMISSPYIHGAGMALLMVSLGITGIWLVRKSRKEIKEVGEKRMSLG